MYCPNCGAESKSAFCTVCGAPTGASGASRISSAVHHSVIYAGFWNRVGASFIDSLILFLPSLVIAEVVARSSNLLVSEIVALAIQGAYMWYFLTKPAGQTIGNRAVGTCVRNVHDGARITTVQVFRRYGLVALYSLLAVAFDKTGTSLVGLVSIVDVAFMFFTPERQTLHDLFARTIVVRT